MAEDEGVRQLPAVGARLIGSRRWPAHERELRYIAANIIM
jgi:hypothetical protein